jgi:hypothetical protein
MNHEHGSQKPKTKVAKLDVKECFIIANANLLASKIYRFWDPEKNRVFTTSDIEFEEKSNSASSLSPVPLRIQMHQA